MKQKTSSHNPVVHNYHKKSMHMDAILRSYSRYAPVYDHTFGWLLSYRGRSMAARLTNQKPGKILEVGVGTGISLPYYHSEHRVHGIDISPDMLARAHHRVKTKGLANVESLEIMDARQMHFDDHSFDAVVASYVMSVVPEPEKVLGEIERVCKPGGDVVIVNHFAAPQGMLRKVEGLLAPLSNKLGWRPDMPIEEILHNTSSLSEIGRYTLPPFGLFTMLHLRKDS